MTRRLPVLAITVLLGTAGVSHAALTSASCLASKLRAWGKLRSCQRGEQAKALLSKPSDPTKCQTGFATKIGKLDTSASEKNVTCRYVSDGDDTVTDTETGLMWRITTDIEDWPDAMGGEISSCDGWSPNGTSMFPVCSFYSDWRVPNIAELESIVDLNAPGCNLGSPCIDPVFGSALNGIYWSSTTDSNKTVNRWVIDFGSGEESSYSAELPGEGPPYEFATRVVRSAL